MATTSALLFLQFPPSKSPVSSDAAFSSIFSSKAKDAKALAAKTKSPTCDPNSFRKYMRMLEGVQNKVFDSNWASPFKSQEDCPSQRSDTELAGTIWNYLSFLHTQILEIDTQDKDQLIAMRSLIEDCLALSKNFTAITHNVDHPIFDTKLAAFVEVYHQYIVSVWQLSCILSTGKATEKQTAAYAHRCLVEVKTCESCARSLETVARTYWLPVLEALNTYYTGFIRLKLGQDQYKAMEYGIALAHYRWGASCCDRAKDVMYAPALNTAVRIVKNAVTSAKNALEAENRTVYYAHVPSEPPDFPAPAQMPRVTPNQEILFGAAPAPEPYTPPTPASPTPAPAPAPAPYTPPAPAPYSPPAAPSFPQPPVNTGFPEWDAILILKQQLKQRLDGLIRSPNPKFSAIAQQLAQQMAQAEGPDSQIQNMVDQYKANPAIGNRDTIISLLAEPQKFYTQVETRLNRLEATGE